MNKAGITAAIVASTNLTTAKAKVALEAVLQAMKRGLKEDRSVDLGPAGEAENGQADPWQAHF